MAEKELTKKELHTRAQTFVTDLLELGGAFMVHPSGLVTYTGKPDEPITFVTSSGRKLKLYTYSINVKDADACVFNPFIDTVGRSTKDKQIFYTALCNVFLINLRHTFELLLDCCNKNSSYASVASISRALQFFSSDVDERTMEEFKLLDFKGVHKEPGFISIIYNAKDKAASIVSCYNDDKETYIKSMDGKIRKKTWKVFEKMLECIFAVNDIRSKPIFTAKEPNLASPKLITMTDTIVFGWNKLLLYLPYTTTDAFFENTTQQLMRIEKNKELITKFREVSVWATSGFTADLRTDIPTSEVAAPAKFESAPKPKELDDLSLPFTPTHINGVPINQVETAKPATAVNTLAVPNPNNQKGRANPLAVTLDEKPVSLYVNQPVQQPQMLMQPQQQMIQQPVYGPQTQYMQQPQMMMQPQQMMPTAPGGNFCGPQNQYAMQPQQMMMQPQSAFGQQYGQPMGGSAFGRNMMYPSVSNFSGTGGW